MHVRNAHTISSYTHVPSLHSPACACLPCTHRGVLCVCATCVLQVDIGSPDLSHVTTECLPTVPTVSSSHVTTSPGPPLAVPSSPKTSPTSSPKISPGGMSVPKLNLRRPSRESLNLRRPSGENPDLRPPSVGGNLNLRRPSVGGKLKQDAAGLGQVVGQSQVESSQVQSQAKSTVHDVAAAVRGVARLGLGLGQGQVNSAGGRHDGQSHTSAVIDVGIVSHAAA